MISTPFAQQLQIIQRHAHDVPMAMWLGYSASIDNDRQQILHHLEFAEHHIGNPLIRALHGGVIAAFFEFSATAFLSASIAQELTPVMINSSVSYLESSIAHDMSAIVKVKRIGSRIAFLKIDGWQVDPTKIIASAEVCFHLTKKEAL